MGVLICYDIENEEIRRRLLRKRPWLIFNPVHIVDKPPTYIAKEGGKSRELKTVRAWRTMQQSMGSNFERAAREFGYVLVRCDLPHAGTSQVISPYHTVTATSKGHSVFSVFINRTHILQPCDPEMHLKRTTELPPFARVTMGTDKERSRKEDNSGNRYVATPLVKEKNGRGEEFRMRSEIRGEGGEVSHILYFGENVDSSLRVAGGKHINRTVAIVAADGSVYLWDTNAG